MTTLYVTSQGEDDATEMELLYLKINTNFVW